MKPQYKKPSLRDTLMANQRALEGLCRMAGKEPPPPAVVLAPKRERAAPKPSEIPSEHQEQVAFVKWFRAQYPRVRIFAVPNAAMRSPQQAAWLKAEGMSAGCADLWVPEWKLAIEMKRQKGGIVSPEQQAWGDYLLGIGWHWHVCRGFDEARDVSVRVCNDLAKPPVAASCDRSA